MVIVLASGKRAFLHKVISSILIPVFLLSNTGFAETVSIKTDTLAAYYISQLLDENSGDLERLSRAVTPVGGRTARDRADEFGKAWVAKTAELFAVKMVGKVKALDGKVTFDDAEKEFIRQIQEYSGRNGVPRYRKEKLIAAIRAEFAKLREPDTRRTSSSGMDSIPAPDGKHVRTVSLPYFLSGLLAPNRVIKKDSLAADLTSTSAAAVIEKRKETGVVTADTPKDVARRIKDSLDGAVKRIVEKLIYIRGARVRFTVSEGIGRDHVEESFVGGEVVGAGDGTPYFVAIDCIEGTNATASDKMGIGGSGGTSVVVEGEGVGSLGFAPDIYANLIITHVPPDKVQQFKSNPLDPDTPDSDGEEAVYAKVMSELKRIAEANGRGIAGLEVVIMIRGREALKEKALKRIEDEYPGFSITRIEDGTLTHGIDASLGRKSVKHKVLWTVGGLPEGFMNLLSAKPFRDTGAVASLRICSKSINDSLAGKDTAVDMGLRYNFTEKEKSELEKLRPQDHREITSGAKLFTLEDIEGPVDASVSFITDNEIFGIPAVRVEGDKCRVATLRIREVDGKGYLWLEDILVSGFVQIQKAEGRVARYEMALRKAVDSGQTGPSVIGELEKNIKAAKKELEDAIGKVSKEVLVVVNGEEGRPDESAADTDSETRPSASGSELKVSEPSTAEPPGNIKLLPVNDAGEMAGKVAEAIIARVKEANAAKRKVVLGLATGGTMEGVYRQVVDITKREKIDWSGVVTFNLDEYKWLPPSHPQSYRAYMDKHLFSYLVKFGLKMENTYIFDGMTLDNRKEMEGLLARIDEEGGIDLQLLGIGNDCHFAFIEPAAIMGRELYRSLKEGSLSMGRDGLLEKIRDFNDFIIPEEGLSGIETGDSINRIVEARNNLLKNIGNDKALVEYVRQMWQKEGRNDLSEADIKSQLHILGENLCRRPIRFYIEEFNSRKRSAIENYLLRTSAEYKAERIILHDAKNFSPPRAKVVNLALLTILANSRYFPGLADVPTQVFTLAGAIKEAKSIILAATGADKAGAVGAAISSRPSVEAPASTLQPHPDVTFIVTEDALTSVPQDIRERAERNYTLGRFSSSGQMAVRDWGQRIVTDLIEAEGVPEYVREVKVRGREIPLPREELLDAIRQGRVAGIYNAETGRHTEKWTTISESARAETWMGLADWFRPDLLAEDISIGVPKEIKQNEGRVGLTPYGVVLLKMMGVDNIFVEKEAGLQAGFSDRLYEQLGATIVETAEEAWKAKLIVKVKEPLPAEYEFIRPGQTIFTYFHLASQENRGLTEELLKRSLGAAVAYETIEHNGGTPLLAPMSEIAGKLAGYWAGFYMSHGIDNVQGPLLEEARKAISRNYPNMPIKDRPFPLQGRPAVVLGGGVVGLNAALSLAQMGAAVTITETTPRKIDEIEKEFGRNGLIIAVLNPDTDKAAVEGVLSNADIIVGGVYKKGERAPLIIYEELLRKISAGRTKFIVDVAIDQGGNVWGSKTTYYDNPVFADKFGNTRFCVANMPSLVPRSASVALEDAKIKYLLALACGLEKAQDVYPELAGGVNILNGSLVSGEIAAAHNLALASRASSSGMEARETIAKAKALTEQISTHLLLRPEGAIDTNSMAIVMIKDLPEMVTGEKSAVISQTLKDRYQVMKQDLRKMFAGGEGLAEVTSKDELILKANEFRAKGLKVIILGDNSVSSLGENEIQGKAGRDWCAVTTDSIKDLDLVTIPFVNLNAMVTMGIGVLHADMPLFQMAYKLFTGNDADRDTLSKLADKVLWIVRALPRTVRFTNELRDQKTIRELFSVAA